MGGGGGGTGDKPGRKTVEKTISLLSPSRITFSLPLRPRKPRIQHRANGNRGGKVRARDGGVGGGVAAEGAWIAGVGTRAAWGGGGGGRTPGMEEDEVAPSTSYLCPSPVSVSWACFTRGDGKRRRRREAWRLERRGLGWRGRLEEGVGGVLAGHEAMP